MSTNLEKTYNPKEVETPLYKKWEKSGYFNPDKLPGKRTKPFIIPMPPTNVTGELHLGHALGMTTQDILIRYHRLRGDKTRWLPGTDHAGIATQVVVERLLQKEGMNKHDIGREAFLKRVWEWKKKYGSRINDQTRRLGASCDWSREAFTMDKERSLAVRTAFKKLYDDGLIYRGKRIISWCPRCASAISDLEVKHVETTGKLYTIRYPLIGTTKYIAVATTRPETMLGDTAIAVHPQDNRYKKLIGKKVTIPLIEREIEIIADKEVEQEFGTGAVKVTPAHDPLDFEIGERHHLEQIQVIDESGKMTKNAGEFYGKNVLNARRSVVEKLEQTGHIEAIVDYVHNVAQCDRCGTTIEPLISEQWFMEMKPLAKKAIEVVETNEINIVPERFGKIYSHWMHNIHDWTLSRQLWWGHQIPVWYCDDCHDHTPIVEIETPKKCPKCKSKKLHQDPDTLDTWFSSGLWTFSTLGWPKKTEDFRIFHPTSVLETAWDILFFWVARMTMLSLYLTKELPFKTVLLHGLVLDEKGRKMSKSKGTGIDPLLMADKYGMDAVRLSLILGTSPGQDFRLSEKKIAHQRNFVNKVWNIGRFIESNKSAPSTSPTTLADQWILSRLATTADVVSSSIEKFAIPEAAQAIYTFLWHEFADWYVEVAKQEHHLGFARFIFGESLKLLHPFAPFVTEELWSHISSVKSKKDLLIIQKYPKKLKKDARAEKSFEYIMQCITAIRTIRNITKTPHATKLHIDLEGPQKKFFLEHRHIIEPLATCTLQEGVVKNPTLALYGVKLDLHLEARASASVQKERERLAAHITRLSKLLGNKKFISKAPQNVIRENKESLKAAQEQLQQLG